MAEHRDRSPPQTTPLDLLLNAIQDSHHDHPFNTDQVDVPHGQDSKEQEHSIGSLLAASRMIGADGKEDQRDTPAALDHWSPGPSTSQAASRKRQLSVSATQTSRTAKVSKVLAAHMAGISSSRTVGAFSTVTIIHGSTGQKSYAKEKRFLLPPPLLRVSGPLLSQLTHVSLSVIPPPNPTTPDISYADLCNTPTTSSTQAYLFSLEPPTPSNNIILDDKPKRLQARLRKLAKGMPMMSIVNIPALKNAPARHRDELRDGLGFPNLWAKQEDLGKAKNFWLRLSIGRPGVEPDMLAVAGASGRRVEAQGPSEENDAAHTSLAELHDTAEQAVDDQGPPDMVSTLAHGAFANDHEVGIFSETLMDAAAAVEAETMPATTNMNAVAGPSKHAASPTPQPQLGEPSSPWATFISNPINIVSKPSQRTSKARSVATCLTYGSSVALWIRINSQNARTKFMHIQEARQPGNVDEKGEETADGDGVAGGGGRPVLTARTAKWSAFRLDAVRRSAAFGGEPAGLTTPAAAVGKVVTYGSIVVLTDLITGIVSEPFRLTKVDKLLALKEDTGPVSELQKVAFARVDADGVPIRGNHPGDWYLSAPSAMVEVADPMKARRRKGRPVAELDAPDYPPWDYSQGPRPQNHGLQNPAVGDESFTQDVPIIKTSFNAVPKTKGKGSAGNGKGKARDKPVQPKTKRNAIALANAAEEHDVSGKTAGLNWSAGREREVMMEVSVPAPRGEGQRSKDRTRDVLQKAMADQVEDCMVWSIISVSHSSYTFFDGHGSPNSLPENPITPCPMLLEEPALHIDSAGNCSMTIVVTHFHTEDHGPFDVFLGPLGPLRACAYQSTAQPDKDPYNSGNVRGPSRCVSMHGPDVVAPEVYSSYPAALPHTVVSVILPAGASLVHTMRSCTQPSDGAPSTTDDATGKAADQLAPALGLTSDHKQVSDTWNSDHQREMVLQDALHDQSRGEPLPFPSSSGDPMSLDGVFPGRTEQVYPGEADFPPPNDDEPAARAKSSASPKADDVSEALPVLSMPTELGSQMGLAPLPVLFVRASDGAGYALGKHLVVSSVRNRDEGPYVVVDEAGGLWDLSII